MKPNVRTLLVHPICFRITPMLTILLMLSLSSQMVGVAAIYFPHKPVSLTQDRISLGLVRDRLPQKFQVTNKKCGKTIVLEASTTGYNFHVAEQPEIKGTVPYSLLEKTSVGVLETIEQSFSAGKMGKTHHKFSALMKLPKQKNTRTDFILAGTVSDDGRTFSGKVMRPDGELETQIEMNVPESSLGLSSRLWRPDYFQFEKVGLTRVC